MSFIKISPANSVYPQKKSAANECGANTLCPQKFVAQWFIAQGSPTGSVKMVTRFSFPNGQHLEEHPLHPQRQRTLNLQ